MKNSISKAMAVAGVMTLAIIGTLNAAAATKSAPKPRSVMPAFERQRLIVLTDIGGEPDDSQSMVRLLVYSNQIDIEGMVATTSVWMKNDTHPEAIKAVVDAYGMSRDNLLLHEPGFPTVESLAAKISVGQPGYGVGAIGKGKNSPGSDLIVRALESDDPRPVWVTAWGGVNTLAQALVTIQTTKSTAEIKRLVSKLRVYTISDQDDAGPWLRKNFPDLFFVVSPGPYSNATWTAVNTFVDGIDNRLISNKWLAENIQQGHGPLGAVYPDVGWGMEGDTPTFLGLIPNGLNMPDHPEFGGWGGRYELQTPPHAGLGDEVNGGIPISPETRPIYANAIDTYVPFDTPEYGRAVKAGTKSFKDFRVTLWRWRDDFQNDFAARMDWTVKPFLGANHPPVISSSIPSQLTVRSGQYFELSAAGTSDPDGDSLTYLWYHYPEAGSWKSPIPAEGAEDVFHVGFKAPLVTKTETAHFILKVTDKGSPALTRYKRVIVKILP